MHRRGPGIFPAPGFGVAVGERKAAGPIVAVAGVIHEGVRPWRGRLVAVHVDEKTRVVNAVLAFIHEDEKLRADGATISLNNLNCRYPEVYG